MHFGLMAKLFGFPTPWLAKHDHQAVLENIVPRGASPSAFKCIQVTAQRSSFRIRVRRECVESTVKIDVMIFQLAASLFFLDYLVLHFAIVLRNTPFYVVVIQTLASGAVVQARDNCCLSWCKSSLAKYHFFVSIGS